MKKVLIYLLFGVIVAGLIAWGFEKRQHAKTRRKLNNEIAKLQTMQQETETVNSRLAVQVKNIKSQNKELQKIIEDRDEEVLALTEANVRLKDKLIKASKTKQVVVDKDGNEVEDPCKDDDVRYRVDFEHEEDILKIKGFTLTNPPEATVKLSWEKDLQLEIFLTKDGDQYRVYLDSEEIVPTDLVLTVDPSIMERKWYEKIGFRTSLAFSGAQVLLGANLFFNVKKRYFIGPDIFFLLSGNNKFSKFYGVSFGMFLFGR